VHEALGLETVSSTAWGAQRVEEMLYSPSLRAVFSAGNGEVEVYELLVEAGFAGRTLGELLAGTGCVAVAHSRAGRSELPRAEQRLATGDLVHVSATLAGMETLRGRLAGKEA
jgi:trk system potassium uptake protein TrkA